MAAQLNDDVLFLVFSKVSFKTKLKIMGVCKHWRSVCQRTIKRLQFIGSDKVASRRKCGDEKHFIQNNEILNCSISSKIFSSFHTDPKWDLGWTFPELEILVIHQIGRDDRPRYYLRLLKDFLCDLSKITCLQINTLKLEEVHYIGENFGQSLNHFNCESLGDREEQPTHTWKKFITDNPKLLTMIIRYIYTLEVNIFQKLNGLKTLKLGKVNFFPREKKNKLSEEDFTLMCENINSNHVTEIALPYKISLPIIGRIFPNLVKMHLKDPIFIETECNITWKFFEKLEELILETTPLDRSNGIFSNLLQPRFCSIEYKDFVFKTFTNCKLKRLSVEYSGIISKYFQTWPNLVRLNLTVGSEFQGDINIRTMAELTQLEYLTIQFLRREHLSSSRLSSVIDNLLALRDLTVTFSNWEETFVKQVMDSMTRKAISTPNTTFSLSFYHPSWLQCSMTDIVHLKQSETANLNVTIDTIANWKTAKSNKVGDDNSQPKRDFDQVLNRMVIEDSDSEPEFILDIDDQFVDEVHVGGDQPWPFGLVGQMF